MQFLIFFFFLIVKLNFPICIKIISKNDIYFRPRLFFQPIAVKVWARNFELRKILWVFIFLIHSQWHIQGLVWAYHFTKQKLQGSWEPGSLVYRIKTPGKKFHVYIQRVYTHLNVPWVDSLKPKNDSRPSKSITMHKMHRRPSLKLEVKTGWNITWKEFWFIFLKNKGNVKLNFLQCLDTIVMKILSQRFELMRFFLNSFSLIWATKQVYQHRKPSGYTTDS